MKYKNTYFEISLNSEVSVTGDEYIHRKSKEKLLNDIHDLEANLKFIFHSYNINIGIIGKEISHLEKSLKSIETSGIYSEMKPDYKDTIKWLKQLIYNKKILSNLNNKRYTDDHQQALNKHMNENADDGWKLLTMTPVYKGLNHSKQGYYNQSSYGFGYGHDVLEGFVLVWEKNE